MCVVAIQSLFNDFSHRTFQHCEKTIQILQSKLTEYQQKIAVAIKVDRTKDEALKRLSETNSRCV